MARVAPAPQGGQAAPSSTAAEPQKLGAGEDEPAGAATKPSPTASNIEGGDGAGTSLEADAQKDADAEESKAACPTKKGIPFWVLLPCIACGCFCLLAFGLVMFIVFYVIKSKVSPGPPASCAEERPSLQGHPAIEVKYATTSDNVKLGIWRVPGNVSNPVLILHGLECSSRDWFVGLDSDALPWTLWRAGFDVWVGNSRGNFLSETDKWDWTFEQMADYDVPAFVDAILSETGSNSLVYIGHSQGGLQGLDHFSRNPARASRISHFVGLAPAVYLTQQRYIWRVLSGFYVDDIVSVATARPGTDFKTFEEMQRDRCYVQSWLNLCWRCMRDMGGSFMMGDKGFAPDCHDKFKCVPAGTSSDNIRAFADALRLGSFQAYYTEKGRPMNFTALQMPVTLAVGDQDLFMQPADIEKLRAAIPGAKGTTVWVLNDAGHMDMMWGKEAPSKIFLPLIQRLQR